MIGLQATATPGASRPFIKRLILASHLNLYHVERYRHRLSIDGRPLYYFGLVGRKNSALPAAVIPKDS